MKPRILITMHYMELGGAESALLGLLQAHDPENADIDLFLYDHVGELMRYIPDSVNLLPRIAITAESDREQTKISLLLADLMPLRLMVLTMRIIFPRAL